MCNLDDLVTHMGGVVACLGNVCAGHGFASMHTLELR